MSCAGYDGTYFRDLTHACFFFILAMVVFLNKVNGSFNWGFLDDQFIDSGSCSDTFSSFIFFYVPIND